jgi:hypothetical protein
MLWNAVVSLVGIATVPVAFGVICTGVLVQPAVGLKLHLVPLIVVVKFDFPVAKPFIVEGETFVVRDKMLGD